MNLETTQKAEKRLNVGKKPLSKDEFAGIFDAYAPQIYRHAICRVNNKEDAQDITSQVFMSAWEYAATSTEPVENARALLFRIAHNIITDHYRKRRPQDMRLDAIPEDHKAIREEDKLHDRTARKELQHEIEQTMMLLPGEYQVFITWRYIDELSVEEIAALSGKTPNAIYVTLHRALKKMRILLNRNG